MAFLSSFHEKSPLFFKKSAQLHNGKKEGIMVLNVLFGVKRRDGGLGEESTEQVTVLYAPPLLCCAAKFRNELVTLKRPKSDVRSMK